MAAEAKTKPNNASVAEFIAAIGDADRRADAVALCTLLEVVAGEPPVMWGPSIIGYGRYHYCYASGHEGDAPRIGFSPRKANFAIYIMPGFQARPDLMERLGKVKTGLSCLYVKKLTDVDLATLRELAEWTLAEMQVHYPA